MSQAPTPLPARPNVVLIMADQLRWDALGAEGNAHVRTPHLDRLAREGVRFARCYTSSPICMPARASVMTGRWPHAHGLWDNGVRLPPQTTTLATVLARTATAPGSWARGTWTSTTSWSRRIRRRRVGHPGGPRRRGQRGLARALLRLPGGAADLWPQSAQATTAPGCTASTLRPWR